MPRFLPTGFLGLPCTGDTIVNKARGSFFSSFVLFTVSFDSCDGIIPEMVDFQGDCIHQPNGN